MMINTASVTDSSDCDLRPAIQSSGPSVAVCPPVAAIDIEQLLSQCVGSTSFAASLLIMFDESSKERRAKFEVAIKESRNDVIADEAHALKGVAGILAAYKLAEVCIELESAAVRSDWNGIRSRMESLHHEIQRVIDFIPRLQALGQSDSDQ